MSFDLTKKVIRARLPIKANEKLVLITYASYADSHGFTFPAMATVLDLSGIGSEETMTKIIKNLIAKNLLVETKNKVGATKRVREFQINTHRLETLSSPIRRSKRKKTNTPKSGGIKTALAESNTPKNGGLNTPEIGGLNTPKSSEPNKAFNKSSNKAKTATPFLEEESKDKTEGMSMDKWLINFPHLATLKENDRLYEIGSNGNLDKEEVDRELELFIEGAITSGAVSRDWLQTFEDYLVNHLIPKVKNTQTKVNPESLGESI